MQQKGLHIQKPKRSQKHCANRRNEKRPRSRMAKRCERSEGKYTKIGNRSKQGDWDAAHF
jgi:hypothetical protein